MKDTELSRPARKLPDLIRKLHRASQANRGRQATSYRGRRDDLTFDAIGLLLERA